MTIEMYVDVEPIELETKKIAEKVTQRYYGHLTWPVCIKRENGWNSAGIEREGKRGSFYTWWWWHGTIANLLHNGGVLLYPRHLPPLVLPFSIGNSNKQQQKKETFGWQSTNSTSSYFFFPVFSLLIDCPRHLATWWDGNNIPEKKNEKKNHSENSLIVERPIHACNLFGCLWDGQMKRKLGMNVCKQKTSACIFCQHQMP